MTDVRHLIIGGDGKIGSALRARLIAKGESVMATTRRQSVGADGFVFLDLALSTCENLPSCEIVYIVGAITKQRVCREDPEGSRRVNVHAPRMIADHFATRDTFVVYVSSDSIFDGRRAFRKSSEPTKPRSGYGIQKAEAERAVLSSGANAAVLRLSKVIEPQAPLFTSWLSSLRSSRSIHAFHDLFFAPISIDKAVRALTGVGCRGDGGIWQLSGREDVSYLQAARYLADMIGAAPDLVVPASAQDVGIPEDEQPRYTSLDSTRVAQNLGIAADSPWEELDRGLGLSGLESAG